ncbi:MAG: sulfatase, partial [Halobacteriaceae archaeon]
DLVTERSVEFVEENAGEPFFLYTAYNAPHYPMHAPAEYFDRFPDLPPERRTQAAMVAGIDDGVGEILDALEREGVREETVVVFTADHGPSREVRNHLDGSMEPYRGGSTGGFRGHKFSLFEGGHRVPGIVSYPAELAPGESDELAMNSDVLPTVCEFCDVPAPDGLDGEELGDLLAGGESPHDEVYWEQGDQLAVRRGEWKLVLNGAGPEVDPPDPADDVHLSNLADDPAERENRAGDRPELAADLEGAVRDWQADCRG